MPPRPKRKKYTKTKVKPKLDSHQVLLENRELFLHTEINDETARQLIKDLKTLNLLSKKPITLYINSPGGSASASLAIINVMKSLKSKVITIVNQQACSGAALVSCAGDERLIVNNGLWMMHDMKSGFNDYSAKIEDRAYYVKILYKLIEESVKNNTDLTSRELKKARAGELWLTAEDCINKGVVDKVIEPVN